MLSTFINNKFNLQEKINKLDHKIQDLRKDLQFCMNHKNELVVEMEFLIFNDPKNNLNNVLIKESTQTSSSTIKDNASTHASFPTQAAYSTIKHNSSTQTSTHVSSSGIKDIFNLITPPPKRIKKKCIGLNCRRVHKHAFINKQNCLKYFSFSEMDNKWTSKSCKGFLNGSTTSQCSNCL